MALAAVSLDDKYTLDSGRVYLTGIQALVRLPMMQRERDVAAGLNTAGFISGYRGSPLGGFDQALWKRQALPQGAPHPLPARRERGPRGDRGVGLAAGQPVRRRQVRRRLRRCGTARARASTAAATSFKHANAAGTSKHGGVLLLAGDDHACKSSTLPHQSEHAFIARDDPGALSGRRAGDPRARPATAARCRATPAAGWLQGASPRRSTSRPRSRSIPSRVRSCCRNDFEMPPGGLNIRWPDPPIEQELRLQRYKIYAALAYARANKLDRIVIDTPEAAPRHRRLRQVLSRRAPGARRPRHRRRAWPPRSASASTRSACPGRWSPRACAIRRGPGGDPGRRGEARAHREPAEGAALQLARRRAPARVGKFDEKRRVAPAVGRRADAGDDRARDRRAHRAASTTSPRIEERARRSSRRRSAQLARQVAEFARMPYFCSGCPHNTSTHVPEGSRALAGIGCHYMAIWMDRDTDDLHADGRRGRALDRPGAVHRDQARLRQSRRRHVLPLGLARDPRRGRRRRQHHLQDPLQRRGRDDRRPAGRRPAHRAA